jgi:hypothetical protein
MTENDPMTSSSPPNPELRLARDYVHYTGCNIFLTGKAGTGKTTFLHHLKKNAVKRMIVTAPTGVAAINAGGVTLHSFFQLPFGPFIPGSEAYEGSGGRLHRFSQEKKRIIQTLDLLVIDEISMVRADLLDAVDAVLRRHRRSHEPFGGVQLLMIGDLHQLSPVAKQDEWMLLRQYYQSVYFFSSHALANTELVTIELKHIYRQSDPEFIRLLNRVRDNRLDAPAIAELNQRYIPNFTPDEEQGYITLTTHNAKADAINQTRLQSLKQKEMRFKAEITGDFSEYLYPAPSELTLKTGAQVMFLRNDSSSEKRYFNGKIGKIKKISNESIHVVCPGDSGEIVVEPVEWENIKYTVNPETNEIKEDIIGKFKQYPLKLAWAITIHKSQGLTFDKAVIDTQSAFAHGQVYVALSRCRTFEGMIFSSPIPSKGVQTDADVLWFDDASRQMPPSENRLQDAKINYQRQLLLDCFDFRRLQSHLDHLTRILTAHARVVRISGVADIDLVRKMSHETVFSVSEKFKRQLQSLFIGECLPESDAYILERIGKASAWFQEQFALIFNDLAQKMQVETDNKEIRKQAGHALKNFKKEIAVKLAGIKACENGFSPTCYLRAVSDAEKDTDQEKQPKGSASKSAESDIEHPELFNTLRNWRSRKADAENVAIFQVMHQRVLIQITDDLPDNLIDLRKISGVGPKTIAKYGNELVAMVSEYRKKYGIEKVHRPGSKKAREKDEGPSSTVQTSFDMFIDGLTIEQIAEERGLVTSTIEGHLTFYVEKGVLDIGKLVPPEKQRVIEKKLAGSSDSSLSEIKNALGDDYSYGEIRLVIAHQKYQTLNGSAAVPAAE